MKYISIDLETTGLSSNRHQILEFGAILEDTNNPLPFDEIPKFHRYIIPSGDLIGNIFAIDMNKEIIEKILNRDKSDERFIYKEDLADDFLFWLKEQGFKIKTKDEGTDDQYNYTIINVAGKNFDGFDRGFLENIPSFTKKIKIRRRSIDPAVLCVDWVNDNTLPSLDECKRRLNLSGDVQHLAVEDAWDVIQIIRKKTT